ncbi:helix-turn-helix domain-containing protein [Paenibacillus sp. RS8]|uniref:helix-turn-helix domain-containing protein n=1 Tax=Paenibacillus sp. RS8 TaxID=3242681 RepID=UPI0035BEE6C1
MKIGAIMQACRERANLSQEEMSFRIERSQGYVSKVESGKSIPDFPTVVNWAVETESREVVVAYLFGIDGIAIMQNLMSQQVTQTRTQL